MTSATADTVTSEMPSTCRLMRNPSQILGNDCRAICGSKNARCTLAQPGVSMTVAQTIAANTRLEATATSTDRRSRPRRKARRSSSSALGARVVE